jgi:hypothetical protein
LREREDVSMNNDDDKKPWLKFFDKLKEDSRLRAASKTRNHLREIKGNHVDAMLIYDDRTFQWFEGQRYFGVEWVLNVSRSALELLNVGEFVVDSRTLCTYKIVNSDGPYVKLLERVPDEKAWNSGGPNAYPVKQINE